jgi:hypothetical protein
MQRYVTLWAALFVLAGSAGAAGLQLLPMEVTLTGPHARQQLLVFEDEGGQLQGDLTAQSKFTSSNPVIAAVDQAGVVRPLADGDAVIVATHNGRQASTRVKVVKAKQPDTWSFRNHVIPVLTRGGCNSGACHGALAGKGGLKLSLRGYDPTTDHFVLTRQSLGRRVDLSEPGRSLFLTKPTRAQPHGGGQKFDTSALDYQVISEWIAAGAPGPRPDDIRLQRLEVLPREVVLKPGAVMSVIARAWYGDGHSEDVTGWSKFTSSEDLVATVDDEGKVKVAGHGEATISVLFGNLVGAARVVVPLPGQVEPQRFAAEPRRNFVDELVLKKLQALRIPPSSTCTDYEFIRRAFLDAAGILPTPEEVQKFVADTSADKRAQLIERLLNRPEFIDYWAYKWSDLLLVSTRKLQSPAMWSFYQFIRQSVADNKPWNQFAREVLTAQGSTLHNGAANYFVLHKDVTDLAEATSVTFLGMSITCCRCHNHPLEKWTQDQYWSFANLFGRVALKNGERAGDVTVQSQPSGEVPHLRRGVPMPAAPLDAKPLPLDSTIDRRQYLADWLTAADNPYFAKAVINRVWRNFLGRGLVEAEDDLRQTNPPSNAELFDALARDFVAHKYDMKQLMRTIMNSATYQRSSRPLPANTSDDRFYSHALVRRLTAEVILDAYSQVTGTPTPFTQIYTGVENNLQATANYPMGVRALQLPDSRVASRFLDAFGRPDRTSSCSCERQQDSSVTQALHLNNGKTLNDKLRAKEARVEQWVTEKVTDDVAIERVFLLALSRPPMAAEQAKFKAILAEAAADKTTTRRQSLEDLFWSVLTGKEFLFNR